MGLAPDRVRQLTIDIRPNDVVTVTAVVYADSGLVEAVKKYRLDVTLIERSANRDLREVESDG
jgi:translation initiation factor IF-1